MGEGDRTLALGAIILGIFQAIARLFLFDVRHVSAGAEREE